MNLEQPECNVPGFLAYLSPHVKIKAESQFCQRVTIEKTDVDLEDAKKNRFAAAILPGLDGVVVSVSTVSAHKWTRKEVNDSFKMLKKQNNLCDAKKTQQEAFVSRMEEDQKLQSRNIKFMFPSGILCSNKYFNTDEPDSYKLTPRLRLHPTEKRTGAQKFFCSIEFDMYVEGSATKI